MRLVGEAMKIYEIGTGYTSIPANKGAATEIVVENLSSALIKLGHDVTVVDIEDRNRLVTDLPIVEVGMPGGFSGTDEALGIRHKLKRVVYSVKLAGVLSRLLQSTPRGERVVLHFHNQYNAFFYYKLVPVALRKRAIVAYTVHSYIWHDAWDEIEGTIKKRYFQEVEAMRRADIVFVLNEDARDKIVEHVGVSAENTVVVDNGVDVNTYRPLATEKVDTLRKSLGLEGMHALLQVGSVCDRKNQLGAIKALEPLIKKAANVVYLYAGGIIDEEYKAEIDDYVDMHGIANNVRYLGELKPGVELNEYFNVSTCSVFATKAEAFGLVVIESLSSGCPVLCSPSLCFDLAGAEKYTDAADLRDKVSRLITCEDYRKDVSNAGRNAVVERYSWNKVAADSIRAFSIIL